MTPGPPIIDAASLPRKVCLIRPTFGLPHRHLAADWVAHHAGMNPTVIAPLAHRQMWTESLPDLRFLSRERAARHPDEIDRTMVIIDTPRFVSMQTKQSQMVHQVAREAESVFVSLLVPSTVIEMANMLKLICDARLTGVTYDLRRTT